MQRLASRVWRVAIVDHGEDSDWCHGIVVGVHVGGELWMVWLIQVASLKSGDGMITGRETYSKTTDYQAEIMLLL